MTNIKPKAITRIIELVGGQHQLAKLIGLKAQSVSYMVKNGYISFYQMPRVFKAIKGVISLEEMMADIPSKRFKKKVKKHATSKS